MVAVQRHLAVRCARRRLASARTRPCRCERLTESVPVADQRHRAAQPPHPQRQRDAAVAVSWSRHAGGTSHTPAVTMIRSKGARCGTPPGRRRRAPRGRGRSRRGEKPTGPVHDVRVDVDGGDLPAGPASSAISAALQPPEPISRHRIPGVRCACSSMIACTYGADTELIVAPRASCLTRTGSYGRYACSQRHLGGEQVPGHRAETPPPPAAR